MDSEPQSYRGVRDSVDQELCEQAMLLEFEGFDENDTFTPAELLEGRKAGGAK